MESAQFLSITLCELCSLYKMYSTASFISYILSCLPGVSCQRLYRRTRSELNPVHFFRTLPPSEKPAYKNHVHSLQHRQEHRHRSSPTDLQRRNRPRNAKSSPKSHRQSPGHLFSPRRAIWHREMRQRRYSHPDLRRHPSNPLPLPADTKRQSQ